MTKPTTTPAGEMTPEQMLAAVIEAQVKGGYDSYKWHTGSDKLYISPFGHSVYALGNGDIYLPSDLLRILLNPQGLRAAYGEAETCECGTPMNWDTESGCPNGECSLDAQEDAILLAPAFARAATLILHAWLSKPEGDPIAAIKTAYDLLPPPSISS